jgi:hypothetical protein
MSNVGVFEHSEPVQPTKKVFWCQEHAGLIRMQIAGTRGHLLTKNDIDQENEGHRLAS